MQNGILTLASIDVLRGLITAVFGAVVVAVLTILGGIINTQGFDLWAVDWGTVWHMVANTSVVAGFGALSGYLFKNLFSDNNGAVFGSFAGDK